MYIALQLTRDYISFFIYHKFITYIDTFHIERGGVGGGGGVIIKFTIKTRLQIPGQQHAVLFFYLTLIHEVQTFRMHDTCKNFKEDLDNNSSESTFHKVLVSLHFTTFSREQYLSYKNISIFFSLLLILLQNFKHFT